MTADIDAYFLNQPEPIRGCLLALRKIILEQDEHVSETRKYGMPCFCFKKKAFCYLWIDKKTNEPYILFVEGRHIDHPALEKGARARMKILRVQPHQDLQVKVIEEILNIALSFHRNTTTHK